MKLETLQQIIEYGESLGNNENLLLTSIDNSYELVNGELIPQFALCKQISDGDDTYNEILAFVGKNTNEENLSIVANDYGKTLVLWRDIDNQKYEIFSSEVETLNDIANIEELRFANDLMKLDSNLTFDFTNENVRNALEVVYNTHTKTCLALSGDSTLERREQDLAHSLQWKLEVMGRAIKKLQSRMQDMDNHLISQTNTIDNHLAETHIQTNTTSNESLELQREVSKQYYLKQEVAQCNQIIESEQELQHITPHWSFIWNTNARPKLDDENIALLPKEWKNALNNIIEIKSMISILKDNKLDSTKMLNKNTNELANVSLDLLEKDLKTRMENLAFYSKDADIDKAKNQDAMFAKIVYFMVDCFDYKSGLKYGNRNTFFNAFLGTASQLNLEKSLDSSKNLSAIINEENKDNLNYFGKAILEQKQTPKSKEEFICDLKQHAKSGMTNDEAMILYKMHDLPKPPSLLNNEHKKLIKESLNIAREFGKLNDIEDKEMLKNINTLIDSKEQKRAINKKERKRDNSQSLGM